ncbi:MAG: MFS transporter [Hyphomicrobiaceae bacterium]
MIARDSAIASAPPPLLPALAAMTSLQALVAIALFAPGVLAPKLGIAEQEVSAFTTAVFAVGAATSVYGGLLASRFGPFAVATLCAVCVAGSMALCSLGTLPALIAGGLVLGLAFGPETPASSTLLSKLATPRQRPLIFSVRQTGNQIGAMIGSLALPVIAVASPHGGFGLIILLAAAGVLLYVSLRRRYDETAKGRGARLDIQGALALIAERPPLLRLALASMPFSAMQLALNAFFVTHAVHNLHMPHITAGILLAVAQCGGLIGRLGWGLVATRLGSSGKVLVGLGLSMAAFGVLLALAKPDWPLAATGLVAFLLGLTASGWNGVFLAEVARLAPDGRVAEVTGAVLMASYTGLLVGPVLIAALAAVGTLSLSFACLAAATLLATLGLVGARR